MMKLATLIVDKRKRILSDLYCFMHILRIIHEQSQG